MLNYTFTDGAWQPELLFQPSRVAGTTAYGRSISISGDGNVLAVGAHHDSTVDAAGNTCYGINPAGCATTDNIGSAISDVKGYWTGGVYIYRKQESGWVEEAFIKATNGIDSIHNSSYFGYSVALNHDGSYLSIGEQGNKQSFQAIYHGPTDINNFYTSSGANTWGTGAVSIYHYNDSNQWEHQAIISRSNGNDRFGHFVFLNDDATMLHVMSEVKEIRTYKRTIDTWVEAVSANQTLSNKNVMFSKDGLRMLVGDTTYSQNCGGIMTAAEQTSRCVTAGATNAGVAYLYTYNSTNDEWKLDHVFRPDIPRAEYTFGLRFAISADGKRIMVAEKKTKTCLGVMAKPSDCKDDPSVQFESPGDSGAVYVYTETNGTWSLTHYIAEHQISAADQRFGRQGLKFIGNHAFITSKSGVDSGCAGVSNLKGISCDFTKTDINNLIYSIEL
ncbi:MAG: hypothetical protein ISP86_02265 [Shewanellaceae bacterium]|nr:hypothetical protein [Shewanellaceae bacterium]